MWAASSVSPATNLGVLLIDHFLHIVATEYGQPKKEIEKKAIEYLKNYNWTGNIRELRNVIERLIILSGKGITVDDVNTYVLPGI